MRGLFAAVLAALVVCGAASGAAAPTLKVTVHGTGKVTGAGGAIACPGTCSASPKAASVTLAAVAGRGFRFSHWSGACTGTSLHCTVKPAGAQTVGAWFVKRVTPPPPPPPKPPPPPPPGFNPQLVAGTWHGTYQSQEFPDSGTVDLAMTPSGTNAFTFAFKMSGFPGGCAPGSSDISQLITAGNGPNNWNAAGFRLDETYPHGGSVHGSFDFATGHLTASGAPDCNLSETWTLDGTLSGTTINATMTVVVDPQTTEHDVITLTKVS